MVKNNLLKIFFFQSEFEIASNVFRPRPETEQLVDLMSQKINQLFRKSHLKICDLGTGSGVIAISLALIYPKAEVSATDLSTDALNCAQKNNSTHQTKVQFQKGEFFANLTKKFNVIVANFPYIKNNYSLSSEIHQNDPKIALFGGDDGLKFFRHFFKIVSQYLTKKPFLIGLEHGFDQKKSILKLAKKQFSKANISSFKDYAGQDRIIIIEHN